MSTAVLGDLLRPEPGMMKGDACDSQVTGSPTRVEAVPGDRCRKKNERISFTALPARETNICTSQGTVWKTHP